MIRIGGKRVSSVYFVISICISLFALFDGLGIYNSWLAELAAKRKSAYASEVMLQVSTRKQERAGQLEKLIPLLPEDTNLKTGNLELASNDSVYIWDVQCYVHAGMPLRIWTTDGKNLTLPGHEDGVSYAAAGRKRIQFASEENGKRILRMESQTELVVFAEIGMEDSDYQDNFMVISYQDLPGEWKDRLWADDTIELILQSDHYLSDEEVNAFAVGIRQLWPETDIRAERIPGSTAGIVLLRTSLFPIPVWIYVFCSLILLQVSTYWISTRTEEMVIRKAFGMSDLQIWSLLLKEFLTLLAVSAILYAGIEGVRYLVSGQTVLSFRFTAENILTLAVYTGLTLFMGTILPVLQVRKILPGTLLTGYH